MKYFSFFSIILLFASCSGKKETAKMSLTGEWKAGGLVIGDSVSSVDLTPVKLNILKNSRYSYVNNIGQIEAGTLILKDSMLITTDTTVKPTKENAVHILKAENDSLTLRMNINQQEAIMYFVH